MIGGAQGSGVDVGSNVFARACAYAGYHVFGKREYYSNIKGEHSYFSIVVSKERIRANVDYIHLLATFDAETVFRHALEVAPGGAIIYDKAQLNEKIDRIPTIERRFLEDTLKIMEEEGTETTIAGILSIAERKGVKVYPVPYTDLLKELGKRVGETQLSILTRVLNIMAVSASLALTRFDFNFLHKAIESIFKAKKKVVKMNIEASAIVKEYVERNFNSNFPIELKPLNPNEDRVLIQGFQAVALGKLAGGGRFQTYYPITPASDESVYLEDNEVFDVSYLDRFENPQLEESEVLKEKGSILVMQCEDEIACITMAIGASLAGVRSSTATSGPGFSLMVEGLGWAGINEVPVVITLYQRGGPSVGLPTRHEQGDLLFAINASHGEFARIVLASGDIEEAFYDAIRAFNYAERYQVPVIHLVDKAIANSIQTLNPFDYKQLKIDRGLILSEDEIKFNGEEYKRFRFTDNGISPRVFLGTKGGLFWNTGDEHDEYGHITEDPVIRTKMMEKRMKKLELASNEIPENEKLNLFDNGSDIFIYSWGSPKGAILDAINMLRNEGISVNFLQVRLMWPFPSKEVSNVLSSASRIIAIENNYSSQGARLLRERTGIEASHYILKYNGRPITSTEVYDGVKTVLKSGKRRIVLNRGA